MRRPTLLLTGVTGFIGSHIAVRFVALNWNVIALVRTMPEKIIPGVLYFKHDFTAAETLALPDEIDAFIHAAYVKQEKHNDAFAQNLSGSEKLLRALEYKNVKQQIFLSSLSADEQALSVYGRQKAAIEKLFLEKNGTVIRAGLVLGDGGLFASMRKYLEKKNLIPLFGKGDQPVQFVHVDDLVMSIEKIITADLHGRFVVASDAPVPYREFYATLCNAIGVKPRFVRLPFGMAKMMIAAAASLGVTLPVTKDNLLGLQQMKRIPSASDLQRIGITLRSLRESF